jgi:hypothetical protein
VSLVLTIGIPVVLAQMAFYGLRKAIFGIPVHGDWNMEDVRNRLHGAPKKHRKGPNTWN